MCYSYFLAICNYTKKNPFVANLLETPRGDKFFEKTIMMFHEYVAHVSSFLKATRDNNSKYSYFIAGSIGGTIGVLHKWIAEDFRTPSEEVAEILNQLFMSGIMPYLKR